MSVTSRPKKSSNHPWILGGIVLLGLVWVAGPMILLGVWGVGLYLRSADELEKLAAPLNTDEWPAIEVNASDLVSAYREDTAIANSKYKDKMVQVTGTVERIEEQWVELASGQGFVGGGVDLPRVHVSFKDEDKGKMATLTKGQSITVQGKCSGKGIGDSIDVEQCVLVK